MRVLISGVTSDLGRAFARAALGAGHEVVGVGARAHRYLPPGVALTVGDAATAASLVPECDVVVHLSPVDREVPESGGIPALRTVALAAARQRVRFVVPIAHGPDAGDADRVVRDSGAEHVVVRTAPVGGRLLDWQACRTIATLLSAPKDTQWRLLHTDDLVRFLLYAVADDRTGVVSLAAQGVISAGQAREPLRGLTARGVPIWPEMSTSDKKNSAREWGFVCGWSSAEVVADLARGARGRRIGRDGATDVLNRMPMPWEVLPRGRPPEEDAVLVSVALPSMAAECDDRVDPRFPVFGAGATAEVFPGPLTALSIDLHTAGLRAAARVVGGIAGLSGALADEWEGRAHAVFGHRVYAGVSSAAATAVLLPGRTEATVLRRAFGTERSDVELFPLGRPALPTGPRRLAARASALSRFAGVLRRYRAEAREFAATARAERVSSLVTMNDAALAARAYLLRDRLRQGWVLTAVGDLVAHAMAAPLARRAKGEAVTLGRGADVATEQTFLAVGELATLLRADDELRSLAGWGDVNAVRTRSPEFAAALDDVLARIGHRGPGEAELRNPTFGDRPELVLAAAVNLANKPEPEPAVVPEPAEAPETVEPPAAEPAPEPAADAAEEPSPAARPSPFPRTVRAAVPDGAAEDRRTDDAEDAPAEEAKTDAKPEDAPAESTAAVQETPGRTKRGFVEKLAVAGQRGRELARDATMRYTDELRKLVRELAGRLVAAGYLSDVDDAYHLTLDELLALPENAHERVARRRADLERLRTVRLPAVVAGSWRPEIEVELVPAGKRFTGSGVSPGVVTGAVRVISPDAEPELLPGEVLVTRVADVGHLPLLGVAAAVVTDVGDTLSHAAVVARELGIPCVTGARDASLRLATGAQVRVDGAAGTVEVLEPAPEEETSMTRFGF